MDLANNCGCELYNPIIADVAGFVKIRVERTALSIQISLLVSYTLDELV